MAIFGNAADNLLTGTAADDTIFGRAGRDSILGAAGGDLLFGEQGNDTMQGGAGNDTLFGGGGSDTANFGDAVDPVTINLSAGTAVGGVEIGRDILVSIERAVGGAEDDVILGSNAVNLLHGGNGDDRIEGRGGNDGLYGGDDDDLILAGNGTDRVFGGDGDDFLYAGFGDDTVYGGDDDDELSGDGGNDTVYGGNAGDTAIGEAGDDVVAGDAQNDWLGGGSGEDTLLGGAGADSLAGGEGNDLLYGDEPGVPAAADVFAYAWETDNDLFIDVTGVPDPDLDLFTDGFFDEFEFGEDIVADFQVGLDRLGIGELSAQEAFDYFDAEEIDLGGGPIPTFGNGNGFLDEGDEFVSVESVTLDGVTRDSLVLDVTNLEAFILYVQFGAPFVPAAESTERIVLFDVVSGVGLGSFTTVDDSF